MHNISFLLGVSSFCIFLTGCGIIPQTEFQDASSLGTGQSAISITPSPFFECRYQVGIAERTDVSVTGYANAFAFLFKWYEAGFKLQWKQALSDPLSENNWAVLLAGQLYGARFKYGAWLDGPPDCEAKFEAVSPSIGILYSREVNFDPFRNLVYGSLSWRILKQFSWLRVKTIYLGVKASQMYSNARYIEPPTSNASIVRRQDVFLLPFIGIVAGERWRFRIELGVENFVNTYARAPRIIFYPSLTLTYPLGVE